MKGADGKETTFQTKAVDSNGQAARGGEGAEGGACLSGFIRSWLMKCSLSTLCRLASLCE